MGAPLGRPIAVYRCPGLSTLSVRWLHGGRKSADDDTDARRLYVEVQGYSELQNENIIHCGPKDALRTSPGKISANVNQ